MEYILPGGAMYVQCPRASIIYRFRNGALTISTGPLWAQFMMAPDGVWKMDHMDFTCEEWDEFMSRSSIKTEPAPTMKKKAPPPQIVLPESPINKWGVPARVYHVLQVNPSKQSGIYSLFFLIEFIL